jgi:N-acylneuraminate cytidylyltransferase
MRPQILGIVPARGGSKGIPRKNVRVLGGKPLIAHSLEQLRATPAITRTVVSTDDPEIAEISRQWGAEVVERPAEISGDKASSESALVHVLDSLAQQNGFEPELVVFLQATSPLRDAADIQNAIETLQRDQADSLFSSCRVEGFTWRSSPGALTPEYDPTRRPRRQELTAETMEENGSIYVFKPWVLRKFNSRLGGKISVWPMSRLNSFQIDEPADWPLLETLLAARASRPDPALFAPIRLLILDFDGVLTDNRVLVNEHGQESVLCHRGDGWGLARVRETGLEVMVLSTEANPVVAARCAKLKIECTQNCADKLKALQVMVSARGLTAAQVAYVGNDVNDLDCLRWVGLPIAVADAWPEAKAAARLVTSRWGGFGAVREVADWIQSGKEAGNKPAIG